MGLIIHKNGGCRKWRCVAGSDLVEYPYAQPLTRHRVMSDTFDAKQHIQDLLARGWQQSTSQPNVIHHPEDYSLRVRYNPITDTLSISPELEERMTLIIPTPSSKSRVFVR